MPKVHFGTKDEPTLELQTSTDLIAVRTRSRQSVMRGIGPVATPMQGALDGGTLVLSFPEVGVEVYRVPTGRGERSLTERKTELRASSDVRFAGGVLVDPDSQEPVLYTENIFIKFVDAAEPEECESVLREAGLAVKKKVTYATNAYFVQAPEGTGQTIFDIANQLIKRDDVEYCHPELVRARARKTIATEQWHLKKTTIAGVTVDAHAGVEAAHAVTKGEGITIAIIDDGVDIDHQDFQGTGKIVASRDATLGTDDPRPKDTFGTGAEDGDNHGTACAGVACASGAFGASGVAPAARLMPIRLASGLGSQQEADAFEWAVTHGADVISCSWGPPDGRWWQANDPRHQRVVPLPASTKLALDNAINNGRGGLGCVILFAAGNGNESVDNDGYASYPKVIAVAACNDQGKRSVYSDFGKAVWCSFPSSDFGHAPFQHPDPLTKGIWTTDRTGADGYNAGSLVEGDSAGNYTNSFGGTSSACPGAAGVAALALSANTGLRWNEVRELLKNSCDKIDPQGGNYSSDGRSDAYGFGRLNAARAVELAKPGPRSEVISSRIYDLPIPDLQTASFELDVVESATVDAIKVSVDIKHTYIGDLVVTLVPPSGLGSGVVLHNRAGGSRNNIVRTFDLSTTPGLARFQGKACQGKWTLKIQDAAAQDIGTLHSFAIALSLPHADRQVAAAPKVSAPKVTRKRKPALAKTKAASKR